LLKILILHAALPGTYGCREDSRRLHFQHYSAQDKQMNLLGVKSFVS